MWAESYDVFLGCVSTKFSQGIKAPLLQGEVVVTEVDEYLIPSFDAEEEEKEHLDGLRHWEGKLYHSTLEDYIKLDLGYV